MNRLPAGLLLSLYLAQALPLFFFSVALPVILRQQGVDLRWLGLLAVLYLPWALKCFWAPRIDMLCQDPVYQRRLLRGTQAAILVGLCTLALWSATSRMLTLILIGLWISFWSATQDIAVDALAIRAGGSAARASTLQGLGTALGSLLGGAGVLALYDSQGWYTAIVALLIIPFGLYLILGRMALPAPTGQPTRPRLLRSLRRPDIRLILLLIVLYRGVEALAMPLLGPMLVDRGWSATHIGLLISGYGAAIGCASTLLAGFLIRSKGVSTALVSTAWLRSLVYLALAASCAVGSTTLGLDLLIVALMATRYLAITALYTLFIQRSEPTQAGTDFTLLVCVDLLVSFIGSGLAGFLANGLGYPIFFVLLTVLSVLSLWLSACCLKRLAHPLFNLSALTA